MAAPPILRMGSLLAFLALLTIPLLPPPLAPLATLDLVPGAALRAQVPEDVGTVAAGLLLRRLEGVKRVLMIGAHPDDEDSGFLAEMALGQGAETAYLSLTRGDGGQNLIGPELFEGLGVIRTGELEAARALDGGRQYFTRAFDFGYSKTAAEALSLWPREALLADVVEVIRRFRPQVVVSVFSGTPSDGHGHHQAAGVMTREAFRAAGDPERFPEQLVEGLEAWQPLKLLQTSRRRFVPETQPVNGEIDIAMGEMDRLLGRSRFQIAMDSRSQHRSQRMGAAQPLGPISSGVVLVDALVPNAEEGVFSGVDTTLVGLASELPAVIGAGVAMRLGAYRSAVGRARRSLGSDPHEAAVHLLSAARALDTILEEGLDAEGVASRHLQRTLAEKRALVTRALASAAGVVFDVRASDDLLVPGQTVEVAAFLWNGSAFGLRDPEVMLGRRGDGWEVTRTGVEGLGPDGILAPGTLATWGFEVEVPATAEASRLYYLREDRDGAMYRWPEDASLRGQPRDPATVSGTVSFGVGAGVDAEVSLEKPWRFVGLDQALGEFEEPVLVVPRVSVRVTPTRAVWPARVSSARPVSVSVRTEADEGASGQVRLEPPAGWRVVPAEQEFVLSGAGSERTLTFEVAPTDQLRTGVHGLRAVATGSDGETYADGFSLVDYPHIERAVMLRDAETEISVVDVRVREGIRLGYVMGTGDDGLEAIRQMGVDVDLLTVDQVRDGDFDAYDVLVLGVRAYEAREEVRAANEQILDFARRGGVVVNQYNQYEFSNGGYAPHRLVIGRPAPRVSVETQPVRVLRPDAPVFTSPNRLTADDFDGWVQERGLYFASEWDDAFVPLLEMNDPGEPARRGSLLVSSVGEGVYVYAALSFFRQWSQRVPGAYRLFANLISLNPEAWRTFEGR
jgi:LmbE family N-acetylglucosaminyl deacetylase